MSDAVGISDEIYHAFAVGGGVLAGAATLAGLAILVYRRRTVGPVFSATTVMDKVMYAVLAVVILLGIWNTIAGGILNLGDRKEHTSELQSLMRNSYDVFCL